MNKPAPLLIGMDLGTTNGKVACYDARGRLQAEAVRTYPTHYPRLGWFEQNPLDWIVALQQGLKDVVAQLGPRAADVAGLAVSNFGAGLVLFDKAGMPLMPCPTWQDERCRPQAERLLAAVGTDWIGLGAPLMGFPAKLLWAIEERRDLVARADHMTDIKGFLTHWLTGNVVTDPSSGPGQQSWYAPVFDYAGWPVERLPRVTLCTKTAGYLRDEIAATVGLPPGIPVFAGLNDGASATVGSGAVHLGDSITTLATNGACRFVLPERVKPETLIKRNLFSWPFVDGHWICGGYTCSGAGSLQWLADLFGLPRDPSAYDRLLAEAAEIPPGSRGVIFLPYLAGRGTPEANASLRGGFIHVGLTHGRAEMVRAVLEGIAFALAEIYQEFSRMGLSGASTRITGGGSRSALWRQVIADVLDRPVTRAGGDSTLGGAMVVAVGLGLHRDFSSAACAMVRDLAHDEPDPARVATYSRIWQVFAGARDSILNAPRFDEAGCSAAE